MPMPWSKWERWISTREIARERMDEGEGRRGLMPVVGCDTSGPSGVEDIWAWDTRQPLRGSVREGPVPQAPTPHYLATHTYTHKYRTVVKQIFFQLNPKRTVTCNPKAIRNKRPENSSLKSLVSGEA
ncbi:hypothetical protein SELMODRAFT_422302 [Selaginella moellendorffii]|uniref:Uncharacterized protein n=1 Tax=Selaginella moellendorffii TaxID=88036 RepID=D8SHZ6_SELML|nr:hypothetical protein SELMODRAFT_422302 [Selaginella moellendorffii]